MDPHEEVHDHVGKVCPPPSVEKGVKEVISLGILCFLLWIIVMGLASGAASLSEAGVPVPVCFVILIFCWLIIGYCEGMQVSICTLENLDYKPYAQQYKTGCKVMDDVLGLKKGVKRFICGRQLFLTFFAFLTAQVTTFPGLDKGMVPEWIMLIFIDTGFLGALTTLILAQTLFEVLAADYPLQFNGLPGLRPLMWSQLAVEYTGICDASWLITAAVVKIFKVEYLMFKERHNPLFAMKDNRSSSQPDLDVNQDQAVVPINETITMDGYNLQAIDWRMAIEAACGGVQLSGKFEEKQSAKDQVSFRVYPSPSELRTHYAAQKGQRVPRFLLPENHPEYMSPYALATLMYMQQAIKQRPNLAESPRQATRFKVYDA